MEGGREGGREGWVDGGREGGSERRGREGEGEGGMTVIGMFKSIQIIPQYLNNNLT